jgi:hypothetical protein
MMRITIEATDEADRCELGVGRIWQGVTEGGVPVLALVSGLKVATEDAALRARFEQEYSKLPWIAPASLEPFEERIGTINAPMMAAIWITALLGEHPEAMTSAELARFVDDRVDEDTVLQAVKATLELVMRAMHAAEPAGVGHA